MDNQASAGAGREALAFRHEPIIYCGIAVRRGLALLVESEHSGDIERLVEIGQTERTDEIALPDDEAAPRLLASLIDHDRGQANLLTAYRL